MDKKFQTFIIRACLGILGGYLLTRIFFPQGGWILTLILAALVVAAAYASEAFKNRGRY